VRNFQILVASAVKVCKHCLQTASGSGVLAGAISRGNAWERRPIVKVFKNAQMVQFSGTRLQDFAYKISIFPG